MARDEREREWRGRVAAAAPEAPALLERVRLRNAAALSAGEPSYYAARLREAGMEEGALIDVIERLARATDAAWERELAARRERLGVERLMPWDLARGVAGGAPEPAEAAARLGFDLASLPIDFVVGARAATSRDVAGGRVRITAPAGAGRVALHELGHALLEALRGEAEAPPPPVHEGVAEVVAGLAPLAAGDALAEVRSALARAAFERALYVDEESPEVVYWRCVERYVGVVCDDAEGAWARLHHVDTHPGRLAAYVMGAAVAAQLRAAAAGVDDAAADEGSAAAEQRLGEMIRALAAAGRSVPWEVAVGLVSGGPFSTEALEGELARSAVVVWRGRG